MFNVQSAFFDKYGSPISGIECSVTMVQVVGIGTNVVVAISAVEAGRLIRCDMIMSVPGGTETFTVNHATVPSSGGTLTFMGNIVDLVDRRGAGNYSISNVKLFDENTGTNLYSGNPGGGGYCTSMNIGNGGGSQGTVLVTISPTATVAIGANKTIIPTCKNHSTGATVSCPSLVWSTGDNDILTVSSSGVITGVSEGTTWLQVMENVDYPILNDNDTCEVTITSGGNMNSTITATYMPDGRVRITVNIGIGDPITWEAVVSSKQDHGLGQTGVYGYPYYVEEFYGSNTYTTYRTYSAGNYVVELALQGMGVVDYSYFDVPGGGGGGGTINYSGFAKNNGYGGCIEFDTCTVPPTEATGPVRIMNQITVGSPGSYSIKNRFTISGTVVEITGTYNNLSAGTQWVCQITSNNYEAGKTYVHTGAWFV